ncbi:MAG: HAMP domain-containing protein [Clostridiales bacterium]|uniref:sensor histidine kinase n=1 Tax=Provencibacterium massiliense TaxID=1841868 RepID=UPI0009A86F73|nr:ATP-binding protein [Provencibacterium massiliense]PWM40549.1 MAG: HAMP domain-containing protein [Clostridiales bacterium]RGB67878.1 HAMP domain-containing protein [Harryflintia acetispora]
MKKLSIKAKVTLWYTALVFLLIVVLLGDLFYFSSRVLYERAGESLSRVVEAAAGQVHFERGELDEREIGFYADGVSVFLYDDQGRRLAPRSGSGPKVNALLEDGVLKSSQDGGERWLVYDRYTQIDGVSLWIRGVTPDTGFSGPLGTMLLLALIASPFLLLIAAGGGYLITKRAFLPIEHMIGTVRSISGGNDLSRRIGGSGAKDEIARLGGTFDEMFDRLQTSFEDEKRFTSDASHELRTPAAIILSQCEYALEDEKSASELRESVRVILRQAKRMNSLIARLLLLARADNGRLQPEFEEVDLGELCAVVCEELEPSARQEGLTLHQEIEGQVALTADQTLLMRLVTNLLSNAIRYNRPGGSVTLRLRTEGENALLSVRDTGIGIAPEHLPKIFGRFYRADAARTAERGGTGLGLSIVRSIAQVHGGSVEAQSTLGEGSDFTVTLPLRREENPGVGEPD